MTRDAAFALGLHVLLALAMLACLGWMPAPEGGLAAGGMLVAHQLARLYALWRDVPGWLVERLAETIENPREPKGTDYGR